VDYLLQFCPGATSVKIGSMRDTGLTTMSVKMVDNTVGLVHSGLPPDAPQPGVDYPLDTGDNRFENRSLQVGNRILNVATINFAGYAAAAAGARSRRPMCWTTTGRPSPWSPAGTTTASIWVP
jgi:hypothetical protein